MEHYHSKKSSIRDSNTVVYEALDRGHQSDITRIKKPDKVINSNRRMFTYIGSVGGRQQQQQQKAHVAPPPRLRTPSKMTATPRSRTPHSKRLPPRSRSQSVVKHKPHSIKQQSNKRNRSSISRLSQTQALSSKSKRDLSSASKMSDNKKDRTSRSVSLTGKKTSSRSSSINSKKSREMVSVEIQRSKPNTPIAIELPPSGQSSEIISPAILVGDEQKIETKDEPTSPILPTISSTDEDNQPDEDDIPSSPSVVGYRKIVYNENDDKWVEHWKIEEDLKRAQKKAKMLKMLSKLESEKKAPKVHPVKGRITSKIQVMFPTAIVKQDRRHGGSLYQSILMTDPLRIELHKRRAPIVPTYYQEHIAKFGKLPFRNNPRPHPIV